MRSVFAFLFLVSFFPVSFAQTGKDSVLLPKDSVKRKVVQAPVNQLRNSILVKKRDSLVQGLQDSIKKKIALSHPAKRRNSYAEVIRKNPYFNFTGKPRDEVFIKWPNAGKDGLFYLLTGLVMYFALTRLLFRKYLSNLFAVFFRVSLKQKQIREQLLQSPLPSLLLNIFFIICGGIYITFLLKHFNFVSVTNSWILMLYSTLALGATYVVKLLILKVMGWILNITEATDTYIFVVFLVNKLLGIFLIPFVILMAFSTASIINVLIIISFTMIAIFFAYRYIISYAPVRKEIKVSQFHFFLYLCAFEIMPLLLIYKVLLNFFERST